MPISESESVYSGPYSRKTNIYAFLLLATRVENRAVLSKKATKVQAAKSNHSANGMFDVQRLTERVPKPRVSHETDKTRRSCYAVRVK